MRSTERVDEDAITTYADLAKPEFRGRVCLRTSNNEYNQSWVADRIAKHGEAETEELLESIMANEPKILGSDVDVLEAIAAGDCDVGLTNHYYLARELKDDPDFPVAPAWPDQDGAGAHTNVSGVGLVKGAGEQRADAIRLMEFLTAREAQEAIVENGEFAANPDVPPAEHISDWADVKTDPIDVEQAGPAARGRGRADAARGVGVGRSGWTVAAIAVAALVVAPLLVLPASFLGEGEALDSIAASLLPDALRASLVLAAGVGAGTLVLGGSLAALVSFYDFPGRRWLDWALVLPMAMPAYVLVFVLLGQYDAAALGRAAARAAFDRRHDRRADRRPLPVRVRARAQRLPRPVAAGVRGGAHARALARRRRAPGRAAAGAARAGRRRGARGDGGAGRLRGRQPAQLPRAHRRDLPRLVRRVRPGRGAPARDRCSSRSRSPWWRSSSSCAGGPATTRRSRAATP